MSLFSRVGNTPSAINTTAANTFGQTPSAATGGLAAGAAGGTSSLFGQSASSQAPATAGLFGQTTSAAPAGGLFGATAATTAAPAAGGLFGNAGTTTTTSAPAGGLFGATPTPSVPAVGSTGGLFGAAPAGNAPAGGGLFGNPSSATPAPAAGGLFGTGTSAQAATSAGGLFNQQGQKAPGGLFGQTAPQPASQAGNFASTIQQPQNNLFGQSQQQPQQSQAVEMNFHNMRGTTRYEELHQDVKSILDFMDDYIQKAIGISQELSARSVGHKEAMESVDADVDLVSRKLGYTSAFLNNDGHSIGQLHNASTQLINTASLSTRTIDILRLPISQRSQYLSTHHTSNPEYSLIPYFEEKTGEIEGKAENFLATVGEVERTLEAIERDVGTVDLSVESKAREVAKAEKFVFQGMISVAEKVAVLNENMKSVTR